MPDKPYDPLIVAHRGLHGNGTLPENSLPAFRAARRAGFAWVECDVWGSADEEVVILHDETLDRTTEAAGPVASRRWAELRGVRLRDARGRVHDTTLPRLSDLTAGDPDVAVFVEVKPPDASALVRTVLRVMAEHPRDWLLQSFDAANVAHASALAPTLPVAFLVEDRDALERGIAAGFKRIHLDHALLDDPTARRLRQAGVAVGVWTVNEATDLRRVMALRVDAIISDDPVLARQVLSRS